MKVKTVIKELQDICSHEGCVYVHLGDNSLIYSLESLIIDDYEKEKVENIALGYYREKYKKDIKIGELKEKHYDMYYSALHDFIFDFSLIGENVYHIEDLVSLLEDDPESYFNSVQELTQKYHKNMEVK